MRTRVELVTLEAISPARAWAILQGNRQTRMLDMNKVFMLAQNMRAGSWRCDLHGIRVDRDGQLLDGQHRLHAVILSGCTVAMSVGVIKELRTD